MDGIACAKAPQEPRPGPKPSEVGTKQANRTLENTGAPTLPGVSDIPQPSTAMILSLEQSGGPLPVPSQLKAASIGRSEGDAEIMLLGRLSDFGGYELLCGGEVLLLLR